MKKLFLCAATLLLVLAGACTANGGQPSQPPAVESGTTGPAGMAPPYSGVTGDPSAYPDELEVSGTVQETNDSLVLILLEGGGEYMLRFSENSRWDDGVETDILAGNKVTCMVKPEPTLTTPSQGEVIEVISNVKGAD